MKKYLAMAAASAVLALAGGANAATVVFDFDTMTGLLHNSETYTVSGLSVIASGYNQSGSAIDLYGKRNGGDENGLGLSNDPSGDHEIYYNKGFVQLNVHSLAGDLLSFAAGSTTDGEQWTVYGSNTAGSYSKSNAVITGVDELSHKLTGSWKYYDFVETGTKVGHPDSGENFLLSSLTATSGVPEPATWGMMLIGVGMVGGSLRRRQAATLA